MDIESISAGLGAARAAKDLIASLIKRGNAKDVLAATSELQAHLAEIIEDLLTVQIERGELWNKYQAALRDKDELANAKFERSKYTLVELAPQNFALQLKPDLVANRNEIGSADGMNPVHYICQPCMDIRGHLAVLQQQGFYTPIKLECPECKTVLLTNWPGKVRPRAPRGMVSRATTWD